MINCTLRDEINWWFASSPKTFPDGAPYVVFLVAQSNQVSKFPAIALKILQSKFPLKSKCWSSIIQDKTFIDCHLLLHKSFECICFLSLYMLFPFTSISFVLQDIFIAVEKEVHTNLYHQHSVRAANRTLIVINCRIIFFSVSQRATCCARESVESIYHLSRWCFLNGLGNLVRHRRRKS